MTHTLISEKTTYTLSELAERFRVSEGTVRTWVREGKIPKPLPFAGRNRWDAAAFERWLAEQTEASHAK
jgi:excisionase family DNA binding protein